MNKWERVENFLTIDDSIPVVKGVEKFISEFPAKRMLILCGERGTGKSHLVFSIVDSVRDRGEVMIVTPGMALDDVSGDLIIFENVNFYSEDAVERVRSIVSKEFFDGSYVVTCRGDCENAKLRRIVDSYKGEKEFFYLPQPPYELKKGILRRYLKFAGVPLFESSLDFLLEKLPWPYPLRIVDLLKARGILGKSDIDDKLLMSLIREFQGEERR